MQLSGQPPKIELPLANSSTARAAIPATAPAGPGRATQQEGFPPLTRTDPLAGGIPPDGLDMNGMLYLVSAVTRWMTGGGKFQYDSAFANSTNVAGYPKGATLLNAAGTGEWRNQVDGNTSDPDSGGANWVPAELRSVQTVATTGGTVTLTPAQAAADVIVISGTLTSNTVIVFPAWAKSWVIVNTTTGAFGVTCRTAGGAGVTLFSGATAVYGDETNIVPASSLFGISQTEQDLTASRSLGTTFFNTTPRPIVVCVSLTTLVSGATAKINISGVQFTGSSYPAAGLSVAVTGVVRPGASYQVPNDGAYSLANWTEIR